METDSITDHDLNSTIFNVLTSGVNLMARHEFVMYIIDSIMIFFSFGFLIGSVADCCQ